jgi:hypothetical protein
MILKKVHINEFLKKQINFIHQEKMSKQVFHSRIMKFLNTLSTLIYILKF